MATLQDPQGARFAIWQPKKHIGADIINEPGTMCWNELWTPDVEAARKFYSALFDWRVKPSPQYTELYMGDVAVGGMMQADPKMSIPPNWMPYFAVADADGALKKAKSLGVKDFFGPHDVPNVGRFVIFNDPQGARFAVIKLTRV
jgi:predicted enzyme related to lactoylglutathione lyase